MWYCCQKTVGDLNAGGLNQLACALIPNRFVAMCSGSNAVSAGFGRATFSVAVLVGFPISFGYTPTLGLVVRIIISGNGTTINPRHISSERTARCS